MGLFGGHKGKAFIKKVKTADPKVALTRLVYSMMPKRFNHLDWQSIKSFINHQTGGLFPVSQMWRFAPVLFFKQLSWLIDKSIDKKLAFNHLLSFFMQNVKYLLDPASQMWVLFGIFIFFIQERERESKGREERGEDMQKRTANSGHCGKDSRSTQWATRVPSTSCFPLYYKDWISSGFGLLVQQNKTLGNDDKNELVFSDLL